jgi:hypothetical protein
MVICPADLNDDGLVNGLDLGILLAQWDPQNARPFCPQPQESGSSSMMLASTAGDGSAIFSPAVLSLVEAMITANEIDAAVAFIESLMGTSTQEAVE